MEQNIEKSKLDSHDLKERILSDNEERTVNEILTKIDILEFGKKPERRDSTKPRRTRASSISEKTHSF